MFNEEIKKILAENQEKYAAASKAAQEALEGEFKDFILKSAKEQQLRALILRVTAKKVEILKVMPSQDEGEAIASLETTVATPSFLEANGFEWYKRGALGNYYFIRSDK